MSMEGKVWVENMYELDDIFYQICHKPTAGQSFLRPTASINLGCVARLSYGSFAHRQASNDWMGVNGFVKVNPKLKQTSSSA